LLTPPSGVPRRSFEPAGIGVEVDPSDYPNGRFARPHDPEGNAIQLWQESS
jgi:predicted enzyme related to lactoylglutathione lyase